MAVAIGLYAQTDNPTISKDYDMKTLNMRLLTVAMTLATTAAGLMAVTREGKEEEKVSIVKTTFAGGTAASGTEGTTMVADGN